MAVVMTLRGDRSMGRGERKSKRKREGKGEKCWQSEMNQYV